MTSPPTQRTPIGSVSASGSGDRESARTSDSSQSYSRPDSSGADGAGQPKDWWSRLSQAQIDLLTPLSAQLFEKLDDVLFDRSGTSFQQFFEGMRILRKNRDVLIQGWFDRLDEAWLNLKPQVPGAFKPRLVSAAGAPVDDAGRRHEFSLVDEVTLERGLAIDSAVARGMSLCRMELPPLCHRLTLLRNGATMQVEDVPASPALLVQTFAKSLDELSALPVEVSLVVFKLFDRVVMSTVETVCKELNRILVQGGVAPQWTWSPTAHHRAGAVRPTPPARSAPAAPQAEPWDDPSWLETVPSLDPGMPMGHGASALDFAGAAHNGIAELLEYGLDGLPDTVAPSRLTATVRALLEHRRMARYTAALEASAGLSSAHHYGNAGASRAGMPVSAAGGWNASLPQSAPQALELHTLMEVLSSLPPPKLPTSWVGGAEEAWDPASLKRDLNRSLHRLMNPGAAPLAEEGHADAQEISLGDHEDVIDMVAMMFGFIQQDQALPSAVQALLSRMQLPYLRLALVDPAMFSDSDHPARALMDRLAEIGKGCIPGSPLLAEKMLKMHALVARIVDNHDNSRAFFEREWTQFRNWSDSITQRAAKREQDEMSALVDIDPRMFVDEPQAVEEHATEEAVVANAEAAGAASTAAEIPQEKAASAPAAPARESGEQQALRTRMHQIRLGVTARMRERLDGRIVPEGLRHALSLLWVNHQTRVCQQYGERSYEASWLDRQLDAVVGLFSVKPGTKAQSDLDQDWPGIERAWSRVLAEGPAPAEARGRWIATFRHWADFQTGRIAPDPSIQWNWQEGFTASAQAVAPALAPNAPLQEAPPEVRAATDAEPAEKAPAAANAAASAPAAERHSAFRIKPILTKQGPTRWTAGDWIEFKDEAAEGDAATAAEAKPSRAGRGKVSWIGSFTGRTILVKPDGTMWREESRADLDDLLDRGLAFIVPRNSLFDRSLQSMFEKLREAAAAKLS